MNITSLFNRMGDFMLFMPVASWHYKKTGEKFHWILTSRFSLYIKLEKLLLVQPFTEKVTYLDVPMAHQDEANYRTFDPSKHGIEGKNLNLAFHHYTISGKPLPMPPPKETYIPQHFAEMFDMGVDTEFKLEYPKIDCPIYDDVWIESADYRHEVFGRIKEVIPTGCVELKHSDSIELNVNLAMNAKNVWTTGGGFSALMDLLGKEVIIYNPKWLYDEADRRAHKLKHRYIWIP